MYVTRPISMYKESPAFLLEPPPEGPNSGILVLQDDESEPETHCCGLFNRSKVRELPFPQNKSLELRFSSGMGPSRSVQYYSLLFIPLLNQPLSSNQYYVIKLHGRNKGEAFTSSKEGDKETLCFCRCASDLDPKPLDLKNIYQQFEIQHHGRTVSHRGGFVAKSVAQDGIPPAMLRKKGWQLYSETADFKLGEAAGIDSALRARLPPTNFGLSFKSSKPVVVGKWYCPFVFVKEGIWKFQMNRTMFYEMTLEQRWEQIFESENDGNEVNSVTIDVAVKKEVIFVAGEKAEKDKNICDGVIWFRNGKNGGNSDVGLSSAVVERMKWEQERVGWVEEEEKEEGRVKRNEKFGGENGWKSFGLYVLVERFVLKRKDGSLVMSYDYKHIHQTRSLWES